LLDLFLCLIHPYITRLCPDKYSWDIPTVGVVLDEICSFSSFFVSSSKYLWWKNLIPWYNPQSKDGGYRPLEVNKQAPMKYWPKLMQEIDKKVKMGGLPLD
jgi:rhamnogalacturonyl hydrolase YesR